jgi:two-component system, chemotaxis family, chemotaxis protein CheY
MAQMNRPRVLIAEDESHCRVFLKALLASMHCEVVGEAKTGAEVLKLYKELKPHLLLLDINMPLKTGDEVLKEILSEFPNAFVIMLTSVADLESVERCIELGAANYIRKDTPVAEIRTSIKEAWQSFLQERRKVTDQ